MVDVRIVPFEPEQATQEEWARLHAYRHKRHQEVDPDDPELEDATIEAIMKRPDLHWERQRFAVLDPAKPDAYTGWLAFDVGRPEAPDYEENKHILWTEMEILIPYRRQGIGRRLLREAARVARKREKSLLIGWTQEADGMAFCEAIGAEVGQRARQSRLKLNTVDWNMVALWVAEGPERSPVSTVRWFTNCIDDDFLEEFAQALTEVWNMMPRDNLKIGDEVYTSERIREDEARLAEAGATILTAITQEADGAISGLTQMGYFPDEDWIIDQWMTGVRRSYRGRGLGKWLKAAMLQRVREDMPQVKVVCTGNAFSNAPMLSINARLGFKLYRESIVPQIRTKDLEAYLGRNPQTEKAATAKEDGLAGI
ncbi:MAG: GNAT family N-acetyltransferase [Candidatus Thermoplasmatota archaeon]|nr:GNAT family N-acetyltransferase [Candidatus Thermoplasmatota archaeon]